MSRKIFPLILFFILPLSVFSQANNSAQIANRRTAMRYLQLAKQNLSDKNWDEADSASKIGLAYDNSISDLWYINAAAKMNRGDKKSDVLPLVTKALNGGEWVDYNKDGARILYADILCAARNYKDAVSVLDENPFIYSADAEYIRAKALYNEGTSQSIEDARLKIDAARRVYPADARFAELFYTYEYKFLTGNNGTENASPDLLVQKIADNFLASIANYTKTNPELELLASVFVEDSEKKSRLIKAFDARGEKSPLYPVLALNAGLIDERTALDYFYGFSDKSLQISILHEFIKSLNDESSKKEFAEYLNAYSGTLFIDTDGDLAANLIVDYNRGRPSKLSYDKNQDDDFEWTSSCDFGVPLNLSVLSPPLEISYGNWPYIQKVVYKFNPYGNDDSKDNQSNNSETESVSFDMIADSLSWCPFTVESDENAKKNLGIDFFVPALVSADNLDLSGEVLINSALSYTIPSKERKNAFVTVTLLNGFALQATYSVAGKTYAVAKFENGFPVSRVVDTDGDGVFETVEEYGFTDDLEQKFISEADEMQIITNIFGKPASKTGIYLKSIKIDRDGDTNPDFAEEYTAGGGKISTWDSDFDGKWDVRYVKLPSPDGKIHEQSMFYEPLKKDVVTVEFVDSVPVDVKAGDENLSVKKGENDNFYWLYEENDGASVSKSSSEKKIIENINQIDSQGVCIIVEDESERFIAVRIEDKIFAEKLPSATVNNDEKN